MSTASKQQQPHRRGKPDAPAPPAFADVTASVAAASFAARRLPELQALYHHHHHQEDQEQQQRNETSAPRLLDTQGFCSGGGKASSRHLRRRATSFRPRQRHRSKTTTAVGKSRRAQRRNKVFLLQKHETWVKVMTADDNHDEIERNSETATAAAVHWIPTHLWHAKRFCMQNLWHWQVPIQHSNRGARAALRLATTHALVQDVTWRTQPVWWACCHQNWTACRQALDRIVAHMEDNDNSKDEVQYGQGMLHHVDQHPLGAIGPVFYLIQSKPLLNKTSNDDDNDGDDDGFYIYLWGHAAIQDQLWQQVRAILTHNVCAQGPCRGVPGGLACLQIRGKNPSTFLATSLDVPPALKATIDETYEKSLGSNHKGVVSVGQDILCLVWRPRDASLPCNLGVCGWDVLGSSVRIRELFLQCVLKGRACPVGLVEESALQLEAQPPMAVFPRDYGDTAVGESFWQPETASSLSSDWALLREHDSGSTGRVRTSPLTDTTVSWADIVEAPSMVLVRGSFLKPFLEAWQGLECSLTGSL